ncbi:MAG: PQQ-binding-like beta-propeller repeat protein [Deltaproteobacteria bacterium]|nr:PQQ-binding-like beta-propeller repeat protein [Deltaproteobacteria bacterium]
MRHRPAARRLVGTLLLALAAGCADRPPGIRVVGLESAPCESGGAVLFGTVPVRVVADGDGTFSVVRLSANEGPPQETTTAPFVIDLDTTALPDGTARLVVEGVSGDGTVSTTLEVCVDNVPPAVTLLQPAADTTSYVEDAELPIRVHVTDTVGVVVVSARLDSDLLHQEVECTPPAGPDAVCSLSPVALGLALAPAATVRPTITVLARDLAGHETTVQRTVTFATRLLWDFDPQASAVSWSVTPLGDGTVAVGTDSGRVIVVSGAGAEVRRWTTPGADPVTTPLTLAGGRLYFGTDRNLLCLSAATLTPCWATPPAGVFLASQPVFSAAANAILVGRYGEAATPATLSAYNPGTGALLGTFAITTAANEGATAPPALSADGRTAYIGSTESQLLAVNVSAPAAMARLWSYDATAKIDTLPLVLADRVYVAGFDGYLHAVVAAAGTRATGFSFMREYPFTASVVAAADGNTLYAANLDEFLYALDLTGAELGSYRIGRTLYTSPAVGPGGLVYAACTVGAGPAYGPGRLHALAPRLDRLHWAFEPAGSVEFRASPVVMDVGGRSIVVIGNTNGHVYGLDATPPAG